MKHNSKVNFDKIVGFGDSWVYGDELMDPALVSSNIHFSNPVNNQYRNRHCFLGQLGQHYGVPVQNFGIPGGSLQSTIWTYIQWKMQDIEYKNSLVIVWLTESDRNSFINAKRQNSGNNMLVHSTWVDSGSTNVDSEFTKWVKQFQVMSNCRQLAHLNYSHAVTFFDGQSIANNLFLLQFNGAPPPAELKLQTLCNSTLDWTTYFRDHPGNQNRELIMPDGHPNEMGHKLICDHLIIEIDRAIISK